MERPKAVLARKAMFDEALRTPPMQGKHYVEPFLTFCKGTGFPANVLEDDHVENVAEYHCHEEDVWVCLAGEITFVVNGSGVEPYHKENDEREWKAQRIEGGDAVTLSPGDWLWVPAGVWHEHSKPDGNARLVILKRAAAVHAAPPHA